MTTNTWGGARNFAGNPTVTRAQIAEVRRLLEMGLTVAVVRRRTGLSRTVIDKVKAGAHPLMHGE